MSMKVWCRAGFAGFRARHWLVLSALALVVLAGALALSTRIQAQATDRAKMLGQKMFCVCGCTQILTACNHVGCQYSHKMLAELDERIARGDSDELILQSFVQEYGATVLAEPPAKGFNWAAWIVPIVVPIGAFFLVWQLVRRWKLRSLAVASGPPLSPELLSRARAEANKVQDE
jgi:cytochrome c-type biogenesis protein CcmH